jgi:hypothetical protein
MSSALAAHPLEHHAPWSDDELLTASPDTGLASEPFGVEGTHRPPEAQRADDLSAQFELLADELAADSLGVSSTRRLMQHPAYIGILSLGDEAIPLLLERLEAPGPRPVWLRLLSSLTSFVPGAGQETIPAAAEAWLQWGKRSGLRTRLTLAGERR